MSDFDPTTTFFILYESMGVWLWALLGLALILQIGVVMSALRLYHSIAPAKRRSARVLWH